MFTMEQYVLALDAGTTSCRCILFDRNGRMCGVSQREFTQHYPKPGWVEHDPMEIWAAQSSVLAEQLALAGKSAAGIAALGITNQRETTVVWDRHTGQPVYNAIVWQCRRTADLCEELKKDEELTRYIQERTGLLVDAYFSATKIKWILDNVEGARERAEAGDLLFGTVDTWLLWNLTQGAVHATDYTNASRTMLYDIRNLCWDERICSTLGIPMSMLPEVHPSSYLYGTAQLQGLKLPVAGIAGDQQSALFGQTCFEPGEAKNTYGTGCFLLMNTGSRLYRSSNGLLTSLAATLPGQVQYVLEGSVFSGGSVVQWIRDGLRLITDAAETEEIARSTPDTGGVYLVPAFTGLGAPWWDMYARGTITGLTRGTGREHIIRAALESIAYQVRDLVAAMEKDTGISLSCLNADGGASRNGFLMQFQADILDRQVCRPAMMETTALGAAFLAGLQTGVWSGLEELSALRSLSTRWTPSMDPETRSALVDGWHRAVHRSLGQEPAAL